MDRSDHLARVPLLRGLSEADRASLGARMQEHQAAPGQLLFAKGDAGSSMYILISGAVQIFLPAAGPDVRRVDLKVVNPGEHFGELALFDEQPRSASAEAVRPSVLLELKRDDLLTDLLRSPGAVLAILKEMSTRLRDTNALLSQRASKDVVKELDEKLTWGARLADRVAALNGSWTFILFLLGLALFWAASNAFLHRPFDGYPYVFFNLLLGLLVALQGPLIMMSQNRQTAQDRAQAESDFNVNLKNELGIETLLRELTSFRRETEERLARLESNVGPLC